MNERSGPPGARAGPGSVPAGSLFAFAFRPFFLLAGLQAGLSVLLWLAVYFAALPAPAAPAVWHGHEMLFGFAAAVVAGFLLTAVANWTATPPLQGWALAGLAGVWLAGRIAYGLGAWLPAGAVAAVDLAFLPLLAAAFARQVFAARQRRQYAFLGVLAALFAGNLLTHLEALGVGWADARAGLLLAVDVLVLLIAVMGGRIIPSFTANALRLGGDPHPVAVRPWLERLAAPSILVVLVADLAAEQSPAAGLAALAAAVVHGLRLAGWQSLRTRAQPILWVLHVGYGWLVAGLALKGLAPFADAVPASAALHALTVGAIGVLTLGVMSRVALGHTGRALMAHPLTVAAYVLVILAALLRVATPILLPDAYGLGIAASGALWSLGFALFVAVFAPILTRPRADGRPG